MILRSLFVLCLFAGSGMTLHADEKEDGLIHRTVRARVVLEEFTGSLGSTVSAGLRSALEQTDDFLFEAGPDAFVVRGEANGGKVVGSLLNAAGKVLFTDTYDNLNLRLNTLQFADEIQSVIFGQPGIGMTQIAFVSDATGNKEIYLCDADGSNIRQITHDNSICGSPSLRNDAVFLAFTSYVSGYPDIYMIDLRNGNRRRIVNAPGTNGGAAFSPDGERLAMTMSFTGNTELYVTNPGGLGGRRLTKDNYAQASPSWSPDGKRMVYSASPNGKPQLYIMSSAGGQATLLPTGYQYSTEPNWSPTGTHIASTIRMSGKLSVAITDVGAVTTRILSEGSDPCWGADGRHLIYIQNNNALVMQHSITNAKRVLISNMGQISQPSWSR